MFRLNSLSNARIVREYFIAKYLQKSSRFICNSHQCLQTKDNEEIVAESLDFASVDTSQEEEEIEKKRHKHRLPDLVYSVHVQKEVPDLWLKKQFQKKYLRRHYGQYGKASGLNPGIMWPTKEELKDIIDYEKQYHPSLQEMLAKIQMEKSERDQRRKDYETEVHKNMENLDKSIQDYYAKIAKKEAAAEALRKKRELLIDEISEYLGYEVDPKDPKFKEAVEMREKEKKKAQREKKEKENYAKMLQRLAEINESSEKS